MRFHLVRWLAKVKETSCARIELLAISCPCGLLFKDYTSDTFLCVAQILVTEEVKPRVVFRFPSSMVILAVRL